MGLIRNAIARAAAATTSAEPTAQQLREATTNSYLELALSPALPLAAQALLQHAAVFGVLLFLRGFSVKRTLDLHYLSIVFALSLMALPVVFIATLDDDLTKHLIFLEHSAIEALIALRVLRPANSIMRRGGALIFGCWSSVVILTIPVVLDKQIHHQGATIVAWTSFFTDLALVIAGLHLVRRWAVNARTSHKKNRHSRMPTITPFHHRIYRAEGAAGLGFVGHGAVAMTVAPLFSLVRYKSTKPEILAYAWVAVFLSSLFAFALALPSAALFMGNLDWCIRRKKEYFPGQVEWYEEEDAMGYLQQKLIEEEKLNLVRSPADIAGGPYHDETEPSSATTGAGHSREGSFTNTATSTGGPSRGGCRYYSTGLPQRTQTLRTIADENIARNGGSPTTTRFPVHPAAPAGGGGGVKSPTEKTNWNAIPLDTLSEVSRAETPDSIRSATARWNAGAPLVTRVLTPVQVADEQPAITVKAPKPQRRPSSRVWFREKGMEALE